MGRLAARLAGVPVIVHTAHGFAFHETEPGSGSPILFHVGAARLAVVRPDRFGQRVSPHVGDRTGDVQRREQIMAIPNGIADIGRSRAVGLADLRREMGARPDDLVMLSMARLAPDKGLDI